jgi:DNA-binding MarR family transcriptional regulator
MKNLELENVKFDGSDIDSEKDNLRLAGQLKVIYDLVKDGKYRTLREIEDETNYPQSSISAQLRNLRKERYGSFNIEKRSRGDRENGLFEYRIVI